MRSAFSQGTKSSVTTPDAKKEGGARATFEDDGPKATEKVPEKKVLPQKAAVANPPSVALPVPVLSNPLDSKACHDGWNFHLAIGDSFTDLNFLNTASCNGAQAKGAQFSWSRDRIAFNDQWSAKGAVAPELIWINPNPVPEGPYLNLWAIAPTVTFQRVTNSNTALAAQNANVLSYGFSSEALFDRVGSWQVYTRGRASVILISAASHGPIRQPGRSKPSATPTGWVGTSPWVPGLFLVHSAGAGTVFRPCQ